MLRTKTLLLVCFLCLSLMGYAQEDSKPKVVFVTGDDEYRSEITLPMIADILEERHQFETEVLYAINPRTAANEPKYQFNIQGLEALKDADLAVIYTRFRALPQEQLDMILEYVNSGRPVIGLRTSTHAFLYNDGPNVKWNDQFGIDVFGQKWITHHGHTSTTDVSIHDENAKHPILNGVLETFHSPSWLYHVEPLVGDCAPLLNGKSVNSNKEGQLDKFPLEQPVAWTKTYSGSGEPARVFFTTLGHPGDFETESFRKLLINGIYWALSLEGHIPPQGSDAKPLKPFEVPPTH